jgi:hypothetical protein
LIIRCVTQIKYWAELGAHPHLACLTDLEAAERLVRS